MIFKKSEKGVALIITFFVMTIMLSIVLGISAILFIEIKTIRGLGYSVVAFYAADSGIEKTLYYDRKVLTGGGLRGLCDICNTCSDCQDCKIIGDVDDGCSIQTCNDCEISYYSEFDGKEYRVKATIVPVGEVSDTILKSFGSYRGTTRAIELTYRIEKVTPPPPGIAYVDPDGDDTPLEWNSTGATHYTEIDEGTRQPNVPNTDDYISGNEFPDPSIKDQFIMTDANIGGGTATAIRVWAYGTASGFIYARLNINGNDYDTEARALELWEGESWQSYEWAGSWSQADINTLKVKLIEEVGSMGVTIHAMYAEITYKEE